MSSTEKSPSPPSGGAPADERGPGGSAVDDLVTLVGRVDGRPGEIVLARARLRVGDQRHDGKRGDAAGFTLVIGDQRVNVTVRPKEVGVRGSGDRTAPWRELSDDPRAALFADHAPRDGAAVTLGGWALRAGARVAVLGVVTGTGPTVVAARRLVVAGPDESAADLMATLERGDDDRRPATARDPDRGRPSTPRDRPLAHDERVRVPGRDLAGALALLGIVWTSYGLLRASALPALAASRGLPLGGMILAAGAALVVAAAFVRAVRPLAEPVVAAATATIRPRWAVGGGVFTMFGVVAMALTIAGVASSLGYAAIAMWIAGLFGLGFAIYAAVALRHFGRHARRLLAAPPLPSPLAEGAGRLVGVVTGADTAAAARRGDEHDDGVELVRRVRYERRSEQYDVYEQTPQGSTQIHRRTRTWIDGLQSERVPPALQVSVGHEVVRIEPRGARWSAPLRWVAVEGSVARSEARIGVGSSVVVVGRLRRVDGAWVMSGEGKDALAIHGAPGAAATSAIASLWRLRLGHLGAVLLLLGVSVLCLLGGARVWSIALQ